MKYIFGVMSSKYKLESESERTAKLAIVLFLKTSAPIAIYSPVKRAFRPQEILESEMSFPAPSDLQEVMASIIECDTNCEGDENGNV